MPRIANFGPWSSANDAGFRSWVGEVEQMLADCGLVRTADSGQINPATITIPATNNTDAGYSVWRFNDSLQATAPVFIKFFYGRSGTATGTRFGVQVGTGSDGAGSITGVTHPPTQNTGNGVPLTSDYQSFAIHREGLAGLAYKLGGAAGSATPPQSFIVQRTVNNSGVPTADGVSVLVPPAALANTTAGRSIFLRFLPTPISMGLRSANSLGFIPGEVTDSRVGLSPQVFPHWAMLPKQRPLVGSAGSIRGEISTAEQYGMALVGIAPKNYLCLGAAFGSTLTTSANVDTSMLWED